MDILKEYFTTATTLLTHKKPAFSRKNLITEYKPKEPIRRGG